MATGPLGGIRIVDLTRFMAGPYGTQLLAYLGADVIKVEEPQGGDPIRALSKHYQNGLAAHYACGNASKRSVTLDLRHPDGHSVFLDLIRTADVLMENFRPGTLERLGLGEEVLRAANPSLVIGSVTGFGKTGPWASWPAYDLIAQAAGGGMSLTGEPGRPPVKMGIPVGDLVAGLVAALGVIASLFGRERTGHVETVDVSMMDVQIALLNYHAHFFFATGESPGPEGDGHPNIVPYKSFPTTSGPLVIAVYGDRFWPGFCRAIQREELIEDPRFANNSQRLVNKDELLGLLGRHLGERTREEWLDRLAAEGVPVAPLHDVGEALTSPQATARQMVVTVDGPDGHDMDLIGNPIKLTQPVPPVTAPPLLGSHTDEVLSELGLSAATIERLHAEGAA
jgi:CoA:oxalate CoA-transferase